MGQGRAPCCQKIGLNKGSWMPEEDMRLIAYINKHGFGNWRALPKKAGLLRCGKSCRLRWINYLRPDIKRGNFTKEEEDMVIKLHELLGNKWSKIAASLPGRTDNEIKNVWNTHLRKRLMLKNPIQLPHATMIKSHVDFSPASSATTSISFSHESNSSGIDGEVLSLDKMEIPIEPYLDMWDILDDASMSPPVSSLMAVTNDTNNTLDFPMKESQRWLADLEKELGLYDDKVDDDDECEELLSQGPLLCSSPSTIDQVDLTCLNTLSWSKFGHDFELNVSTL